MIPVPALIARMVLEEWNRRLVGLGKMVVVVVVCIVRCSPD